MTDWIQFPNEGVSILDGLSIAVQAISQLQREVDALRKQDWTNKMDAQGARECPSQAAPEGEEVTEAMAAAGVEAYYDERNVPTTLLEAMKRAYRAMRAAAAPTQEAGELRKANDELHAMVDEANDRAYDNAVLGVELQKENAALRARLEKAEAGWRRCAAVVRVMRTWHNIKLLRQAQVYIRNYDSIRDDWCYVGMGNPAAAALDALQQGDAEGPTP